MAFFEYQPNSTIFTYASDEGFRGLVSSKALWLSDTSSLNDPRELNVGMRLLSDAIDAYEDDVVQGVSQRDMQRFFVDLQNFRQQSTCYACCFSIRGDDLPMWKGYANNGAGVSIGFRPTALSGVPGRVQLVRYAEDNIDQHYKQVVLKAAQSLGEVGSIERALAAGEVFASVTCVKHRSWDYEKEVRIVYNQTDLRPQPEFDMTKYVTEYDDGTLVEWTEPLLRSGRNGVVRYFSFPFGKRNQGKIDHKRAIEKVIIGQGSSLKRADVADILARDGFEGVTISQSDCEFR